MKTLQFRIDIKKAKPKIWRRVQVPENYTFFHFSQVINIVFGWSGLHLHNFIVPNVKVQTVDEIKAKAKKEKLDTWELIINSMDLLQREFVIGRRVNEGFLNTIDFEERDTLLRKFFKKPSYVATFWYSFILDYMHHIKLEKVIDLPDSPARCLKIVNAAPWEDAFTTEEWNEILQMTPCGESMLEVFLKDSDLSRSDLVDSIEDLEMVNRELQGLHENYATWESPMDDLLS